VVAYVIVRCDLSHDRRELDAIGMLGFVAAPVLLAFTLTLFVPGRSLFARIPRTATLYATVPLIALAIWGFLCAMSMLVAANL
jgi:hypothetical protein